MAYTRRLKYQGIEPLRDNVLRILKRDMPTELQFIAEDVAAAQTPIGNPNDYLLPDFAEYLEAEKADPAFPFIAVEPDADDAVEQSDGNTLIDTHQLTITICTAPSADLAAITTEVIRRKRAVLNVLWSAERDDLYRGITNRSLCRLQLRGGRYVWFKENALFGRAVKGLKVIATYGENK